MRTPFHVGLSTLALVLLAPTVSAASVTLNMTANDPGTMRGWFEVEGYEGRNPTLRLAAGDEVTVHFRNEGSMDHNVYFADPIDVRGPIVPKGGNATLTFTVPEDAPARIPYWCDPHRGIQMQAMMEIEGGEPVAKAPGPALLGALGAAGVAVLLRRRV